VRADRSIRALAKRANLCDVVAAGVDRLAMARDASS
jgi:hypothetical protein